MTTLNLQNASFPQYTLTLPVSNQTVKFRPFVVKEEKILLLALQSKNPNQINDAIRNVISVCTSGVLDTRKLCAADTEYAFLQIRSKSVGEEVKPQVTCTNCQKSTNIKIKLDEITIGKKKENTNDTSIVINNNLSLIMRYPSIHDFDYNIDEVELVFELAKKCIEAVVLNDQLHRAEDISQKELSDFVDNMMPDQFAKLIDFIQTSPELKFSFNYKCPHCESEVRVELNSVSDFFQ